MTKTSTFYIALSILLLSVIISPKVSATWHLVENSSSLNFISTKNLNVSEIHQFNHLSGSLTKAGVLQIEIDLASVETGIDIRNTRMTEKLFLVDKFPKAAVNAVMPEEILQLKMGHSTTANVPATLTIMGVEKPLIIAVQVTKTNDAKLIATSVKPILIGAADYGLQPGIELLQQIAGLANISLTVPVTFNVILQLEE